MIAADYTIALARAARLVHLASSESISPAPLEENIRSILINTREGMEARDLRTAPSETIEFSSSLLNEHRVAAELLVYRG